MLPYARPYTALGYRGEEPLLRVGCRDMMPRRHGTLPPGHTRPSRCTIGHQIGQAVEMGEPARAKVG